jgi:hypothetical protein
MISLQLQLREPPVECGYPLSAKMLRIKHADCFAILPVALDAAAAFQDFVHIRGGLLEMRQHSAARLRSGYFGVTLILNHLIGPSERRRIECCLRPIRARLRPVRTKLLRNVSRARDMGPLPSRGARSAPQPRLCGVMVRYAENGFISICENATCAWTAVSACQRNAHRKSELCKEHRVPQSLTRRWIEQPIAGRRKEH